ncbi:MAG TPA: IS1380 family transposase [Acidimicrobiales bacterium]|nr:IS1380 family transposase [Acidimicrobiales bacterium]
MPRSSRNLDTMEVVFDDRNVVADGGLVLPMTLAERLGAKGLVDDNVDLGDAPGHANAGHKAMALVASALVGGDSIDDADVLRSGQATALLGTWVPAPSTLGTFLRSFSWADARSLDKVAGELLKRAWAAGAGPGAGPLTIDVDSSICETYGLKKQGARFGFTSVRGLHPLLAAASGTGDVLGVRQRGGNAHTARGAASFLTEVFHRVRAAGASGPLTLRADSGFYNHKVTGACTQAGVHYSITAKMSPALRRAIEAIDAHAWAPIPYWLEGGADVAETTYRAFAQKELRLIVRRVKPSPGSQLALFTKYEHHAFVTDREGTAIELEADHRRHAEVELVVRDLKEGPWAHMPSGRFGANAAWLALGAIAHNLARWCTRLGGITNQGGHITLATLRRRFVSVPGHLARSGRRTTLHLAKNWPWAEAFLAALGRLRALVVPQLA